MTGPSRSLQRSGAPRVLSTIDARARGRIAPLTALAIAQRAPPGGMPSTTDRSVTVAAVKGRRRRSRSDASEASALDGGGHLSTQHRGRPPGAQRSGGLPSALASEASTHPESPVGRPRSLVRAQRAPERLRGRRPLPQIPPCSPSHFFKCCTHRRMGPSLPPGADGS